MEGPWVPASAGKLLMGRILAGIDRAASSAYFSSKQYLQALKLVQQSWACLYG
jgi:hypothetical protein